MTTLLSCVGDSDPIRNYHDGPLLHIIRVKKPEKIVLVHSERTLSKHEDIEKAIRAISDYQPEIVVDSVIIKNSEIFIFDKMFGILMEVIRRYQNQEEEILLNLTSSTPQVISAMFSINRIAEFNVRAFQVTTPMESSNAGIKHEINEDIDTLIDLNEDNQLIFKNRVIEDNSETFNQSLLKRTLLDLLAHYDYEGVYGITIQNKLTSNKKQASINNRLDQIQNTLRYQKLLPEIENSSMKEHHKLLLNGFLILDLQAKRGLTSEVVIRARNLGEFAAEAYLTDHYPEIIKYEDGKPVLNQERYQEIALFIKAQSEYSEKKQNYSVGYLTIHTYEKIFNYLSQANSVYKEIPSDSHILRSIRFIQQSNSIRNDVAHKLKAINEKVDLKRTAEMCRNLVLEVIEDPPVTLDYFDEVNKEIESLLMKQ